VPFYIAKQLKHSITKLTSLFLLWLTFFVAPTFFAQAMTLTSPLKFTNISTEQGLSQSYVFSIAQDKQGYIWLATEDGLNRFDGRNFVHYRHNINNIHSVADNFIRKVLVDNKGILWVGTNNGLSRYNRDLDNFDNYLTEAKNTNSLRDNVVWEIYQDKHGKILISTANGLQQYQASQNNFKRINLTSNNKAITEIRTIFQDKDDNYWLGTFDQHIYLANSKLSYALNLNDTNKWNLNIPAKSLFDIKDIDNQYWLATEQGVYVVNKNYRLIKHINKKNNKNLLSNEVRAITALDDTHIWLGTRNGLNTLNIVNNNIKSYQSGTQPKSISGNWILTIFKDNADNMWLGNLATGVDKYNPVTSLFAHKLYRDKSHNIIIDAIAQTADNKIWFSSEKLGVNYLPVNSSVLHQYKIPMGHKIAVLKTHQNNLWLSTYNNELYQLNPLTGALVKQPLWQKNANINNNFDFIVVNNTLWFIDNNGQLSAYHAQMQSFSRFIPKQLTQNNVANIQVAKKIEYKNNKQINKDNSLEKPNKAKPSHNKLQALNKDAQNNLWLTSADNKIYYFDTKNKKFNQYKVTNTTDYNINQTMNIVIDKHWLWLSSYSQGILLINRDTGETSLFNEEKGLINNNINALLLDQQHNAWVSAANGISLIKPIKKTVTNFSQDYGLNNNELLRDSALASRQGDIYFGGLNGFFQFNPKKVLTNNQYVPMPVLTTLSIANKAIQVKNYDQNKNESQNLQIEKTNDFYFEDASNKGTSNEETSNEKASNEGISNKENQKTAQPFTIAKQLNQLTQLTLAYQQSPFSIEFISPNAALPQQIQYRYKLVGLDKQWISANNKNLSATYTNLSAGKYHFIVQAFDRYNPNFIQSKQLIIKIIPPWWLSTTMLLVYALLTLLAIAYVLLQIHNRRQYHLKIRKSEEQLKLSLWGSGNEMWDWDINKQTIFRSNIWENLEFPFDGIRHLSSAQEQLLKQFKQEQKQESGYSSNVIQASENSSYYQKLEQLKKTSNIHPDDFYRVYQGIEKYQQNCQHNEDLHFEINYRVKDKLGQWVWVLDRGKMVEFDSQQQPIRMTGTIKDISQLKNAEERLKLFAQCIESISDAVVIYNRQFKVVDINHAYQQITGNTKAQVLNTSLNFPLYSHNFNKSVIKQLLNTGCWQGEIENKRANNERYYIDLTLDIIRDQNNNISHFVSVFSDISERKKNEAELRKLANSDTLTGLPNRASFQMNQTRLVSEKIPHALLMFDLDNFKKINDSLGHELGDILLCRVAERIATSVRKHDSIYRLGGDEFGLIIENTNDIHTITSIAKNVLVQIATPIKIKRHELVLHASIGVVLYPEDGASPQELLKNADTAMYHAKGNGGNQYQFFNDSMNKKVVQRLKVEHLIRYGLKNDYFSVYYQPKIEISTGRIAGMEALVRFEHPSKGLVSPVTFIPVSEETGQIIDIGETVLRKSCFATKDWVDAGLFDGRIAVNLSAVQFTQPNLVEMIANILIESKLPAKYLELEITEGTVMDSPQQAIKIMQQIREMGIHLSLDDFGTGYSSLAYLKKFPLNTLKIDKAFVDDIEHSEQGRNMVATIVTIAHNLGLQVVAEGVEQTLQLEFLSSLNCEQLQGYLYSKPLPEQDFYNYLRSHQITHKSTRFN